MTSFPFDFRYATESRIIRRFSSIDTLSICSACNRQLLPTIVTVGVWASKRRAICASAAGLALALQVLPKAQIFACRHLRFLASAKNAMSLGLDPGHPP